MAKENLKVSEFDEHIKVCIGKMTKIINSYFDNDKRLLKRIEESEKSINRLYKLLTYQSIVMFVLAIAVLIRLLLP
jgi:hypothetical protein